MQHARSLLVVDDDVVALSGLLDLLRDAGHRVTGAATLAAANRLLDVFLFDLLIVDLRLGRANGLELVARCRAEHSRMPAIVITGFPDAGTERRTAALGADYLTKPIVPSRLLELVRVRIDIPQSRTENLASPADTGH